MLEISLDSHIRVSDDTVFRELDGESVLLQLDAGVYFGLDAVGTWLWQLMATHTTLQPVFEAAVAEFEVEPSVLERDLIDLVRQLADKRLVVVA